MVGKSLLVVALWSSLCATCAADAPVGPMDFKLGETTVTLTNFRVVGGAAGPDGRSPAEPQPLRPDELLPPLAPVWITFDYVTTFEKSDAPEGLSFLGVGIDLPKDQPWWGYGAADLTQKSGTGFIRLHNNRGGADPTHVDTAFKLIVYSRTNARQPLQQTSEAAVPVRFTMDGTVVLSTTKYKEIQAALQRLGELEKRVQALEGRSR